MLIVVFLADLFELLFELSDITFISNLSQCLLILLIICGKYIARGQSYQVLLTFPATLFTKTWPRATQVPMYRYCAKVPLGVHTDMDRE